MAHVSTEPEPRNPGDAARFVGRPQRVVRRRVFSSRLIAAPVIAALGVAVVIALAPAFAPASIAPTPTGLRTDAPAGLPRPAAQRITNTSVGAQIGWLSVGA